MKYKPLLNNLLVKLLPKKETGIVYDPENEPVRAEIFAIGDGEWNGVDQGVPLQVRLDNIVLFFPRDAKKLDLDGEEYYLLNQNDILLVENRHV